MVVLTAEQTRAAEVAAMQNGLSALQLMENAGQAAAKVIAEHYEVLKKNVVVLAGKGNNGGDGFVVARCLKGLGAAVTVVLVQGPPVTKSAQHMAALLGNSSVLNFKTQTSAAHLAMKQADLFIDAIFGIGFHGLADETVTEVIHAMEKAKAPTVALDLPSGLQCDSGALPEVAVRAKLTITFIGYKPCHLAFPAAQCCGRVVCNEIGINGAALKSQTAQVLTPEQAFLQLPPILKNAHKGSKGRVLIFAGSYKMPGAAFFSAMAAMRAGAGLVCLAVEEKAYPLIMPLVPEAVFEPYENWTPEKLFSLLKTASAVVVGPGLPPSPQVENLVQLLLQLSTVPVVVDAGGLTVLANHLSWLAHAKAPVILTPHPGEMSRLCGQSVAKLEKNRLKTAVDFAQQNKVILLLKGAYTVITAPQKQPFVNCTGNSGLATAGSGDVLSGMLGAFLAGGMEPFNAAAAVACLHGAAAEQALPVEPARGLIARDLIEALPAVFAKCCKN